MALIQAQKDNGVLIIDSFDTIRTNINSYFSKARIILIIMLFCSIFSPMLWIFFFVVLFAMFNNTIWKKYFKNKTLFFHYLEEFSCTFADGGTGVFSKFGYEIDYQTQWKAHYHRLKGLALPESSQVDKNEVKKLADSLAKEANKVKKSQAYRETGIGKDLATRHLIFIGTTGAGKTESLLTWFSDILDKRNAGGIVMVDGKADSKIHAKLSSILAEKGRVTSQNTVNFLKQDKFSTSNTYNPVLSMSPYKGVSFISGLLGGGGEGNADYFKNRGIAMLTIPLSALRIRNEYFKEPFSLSLLQNSTSALNISIIYCLFYGFVREENDRLKDLIETSPKAKALWLEARDKTTAVNQDVQYYEKILNYVTQYKPSAKQAVEDIIGFDFKLFNMAYNMVFKLARAYMTEIFAQWGEMSNGIAEALYVYAKEVKKREFSIKSKDFISFEDIRSFFDDIQSESVFEQVVNKSKFTTKKVEDVKNALGFNEQAKNTIFKLPETAIQQHSYSQQQFTALFQTFDRFPHIFGSPFPDVYMKDIIKNNKVLYVMLPVLELGAEMSKLLGKMIISDMQESGSVTLGGENLNITPTQDTIYKDKITPKPLSMFVADEYGYYRVEEGIMTSILAQFRSLNFCAILSLQETAGLGKDEEQEKALGNTAKFILKSYDTKIKEFVDKQISEVEFIEQDKYMGSSGEIHNSETESIKIEKKKPIDSTILSDLNYGCGLLISNSKPKIIQSYYFGGKEVEPYISSMSKYVA
ncbi:hypothetical protein [Poseidonibacter ostreae]|uniref:Type IV secretion system DNA-binding domain-containing protein n=1 Tax=Poseidonibacter ostreae TaxID=2654171 RepID=A0A6L4WXW0_9BACT|nr:hypothetical protein [Poseidonibacter ostreae]KAB7891290.1 hypothetical protein GBG19_00205 [Poseidonibacter ostreae]